MIRVVLDTNVLVSALLQPLGPSAQLLPLGLNGSIRLCITGSIYAEYEEVIRRPRFQRGPELVASTLQGIREAAGSPTNFRIPRRPERRPDCTSSGQ